MPRAEAGWYPDPEQPGQVRYFDGGTWTDDVRDVAPGEGADGGASPVDEPRAAASTQPGSGEAWSEADASGGASAAAATSEAVGSSAAASGQSAGSRRGLLGLSVVLMLIVLGGSLYLGNLVAGDDPGVDSDQLTADDDPATDVDEDLDAPDPEPGADADGDPATGDADADDPADDGGSDADADADDEATGDDVAGPNPAAGNDAYDGPFELTIDTDATYIATIATTEGDIVVDLDAAGSPVTTNNLVNLAEDGYFDGIIFHRVIDGFVIQGGDPTGTGTGGPGYRFEDELDAAEALVAAEGGYPRGTLAMANAGPDTNGSQFFIVHGELIELPPAYTVFGEVTDGMEVVDAIATADTDSMDRPRSDVTITTIDIEQR